MSTTELQPILVTAVNSRPPQFSDISLLFLNILLTSVFCLRDECRELKTIVMLTLVLGDWLAVLIGTSVLHENFWIALCSTCSTPAVLLHTGWTCLFKVVALRSVVVVVLCAVFALSCAVLSFPVLCCLLVFCTSCCMSAASCRGAALCCVVLRCSVLYCVVLCLRWAALSCAVLCLRCSVLGCAVLGCAMLSCAVLCCAVPCAVHVPCVVLCCGVLCSTV